MSLEIILWCSQLWATQCLFIKSQFCVTNTFPVCVREPLDIHWGKLKFPHFVHNLFKYKKPIHFTHQLFRKYLLNFKEPMRGKPLCCIVLIFIYWQWPSNIYFKVTFNSRRWLSLILYFFQSRVSIAIETINYISHFRKVFPHANCAKNPKKLVKKGIRILHWLTPFNSQCLWKCSGVAWWIYCFFFFICYFLFSFLSPLHL